jgi:hypothetical protein
MTTQFGTNYITMISVDSPQFIQRTDQAGSIPVLIRSPYIESHPQLAKTWACRKAGPMEKRIGSLLVMSIAATVVGASSQHTDAGELKLTLVIYNHAHVSEETLEKAENAASEIFAHAGVRLVWVEGFAYAAERRDALIPAPEDPATLVVKLQPESEAARYGVRSVCGGIGFDSGAIIFVRRFDSGIGISVGTRLGYLMAHEVGHILLGPEAHSIVGIMRGTLLEKDWIQAAQGTLSFTRSQTKQIRAWITKRTAWMSEFSPWASSTKDINMAYRRAVDIRSSKLQCRTFTGQGGT